MTCSDLDQALQAVTNNVYTPSAPPGVTEYITWAVYSYNLICGDDECVIRIPRVQIDAYTQAADAADAGGFFDRVLTALDGLDLAYAVQATGYDPDAASMRLIIQCDVA